MNYELAYISGATSGLGRALCFFLAKQKIPLFLTARDSKALESLHEELSALVPAISLSADLRKKEDIASLIASIHSKTPDLVINNAGLGLYGDVLTYSLEEQMEILEVNALSLSQITIEAARALVQNKKKGTILNIASAAALFTYPTFAIYAASKAYVRHFSLSLRQELLPYGIQVLVACPGQIETPFRTKAAKRKINEKDCLTMTAEKAAALLWKQIQKQKPHMVIDWRYRILCRIAKILPSFLITRYLRRALALRYHPRTFSSF